MQTNEKPKRLVCVEPECTETHPTALEDDNVFAGWRCDNHNPMVAPLECSVPDCEGIHPNAVANEGRPGGALEGWICLQHGKIQKSGDDEGSGGDVAFVIKPQWDSGVVNPAPLQGQDMELGVMSFSTGAGAYGGPYGKFIFQFGDDQKARIILHPDGSLDFGAAYCPKQVARDFWSTLAWAVPVELGTLQRCRAIARMRLDNAEAGARQALDLGNGELAARLHAVAMGFRDYISEIEATVKVAHTLTGDREMLDSLRPLLDVLRRKRGRYLENTDSLDGDDMHDILVAFENVNPNILNGKA